jgi:hypothetical protein
MFIEKIISISSPPLQISGERCELENTSSNTLVSDICSMLDIKNGFYVLASALHVLPLKAASVNYNEHSDIQAWNAHDGWRSFYGDKLEGMLFFAEDVFGCQFCVKDESILSFDPESGRTEFISSSLEGWAKKVLTDNALTGFPLAHEWQLKNGPLPYGKRLLPKIPFILGGAYAADNLCAINAEQGMAYRGDLWRQLMDLPDGAKVVLKPLPCN